MIPFLDMRPSGRFPIQTLLLIAVTAYVFYLQLSAADTGAFLYRYALVPAAVDWKDGASLLPFVTSIFLHASFLHIAGNMLFLWVFGNNVERRMGWLFTPFYLVSGIVAGFAQYHFTTGSDLPIVGASGAIAGVLGAFFVLYPGNRIRVFVPPFFFLTVAAWAMLAYWFALQVLNGVGSVGLTAQGGVAYLAHIGGFLFGALIGLSLRDETVPE